MSKREEEGRRKWKNRSCKSRKNKKYATKCDRLAQELCALDRDKDSRAERERERDTFVCSSCCDLLALSLTLLDTSSKLQNPNSRISGN